MTVKSSHAFAFKANIPGLFKFQRYSDAESKERVHKALTKGELHFASPDQFNDPFEGRPRIEAKLSKAEFQSGAAKEVSRFGKKMKISLGKRLEAIEHVKRKNPAQTLAHAREQHWKRLRTECRIYCASANREHPLLWSHYADSHRGICLHMDHKTASFASALPIDYQDDYPTISYDFDDAGERGRHVFQKSVLTKAKYWAYENEYRMVSIRMGNASWDLGLKWTVEKDKAYVDPKAITGITVGASMPKEIRDSLAAFCRTERPDIQLEFAKISDNEYQLLFELGA